MAKRETKEEIKTMIDVEKLRHKNRMLEIQTEREAKIEVIRLSHDLNMQQQRVKTAEIKRSIDRKINRQFMENTKYKGNGNE